MIMASALASRMSRLFIGKKLNPIYRPVVSFTRVFDDSNIMTSRFSLAAPSSSAALNNFNGVGVRALSSVAQIPTICTDDFGATSSMSPLLTQKQAEDFAAFTYANRHQKGEIISSILIDSKCNL